MRKSTETCPFWKFHFWAYVKGKKIEFRTRVDKAISCPDVVARCRWRDYHESIGHSSWDVLVYSEDTDFDGPSITVRF